MYCTQHEFWSEQKENIVERINGLADDLKKRVALSGASTPTQKSFMHSITVAEERAKNRLALASTQQACSNILTTFGKTVADLNKQMNYFDAFLRTHHKNCDKIGFFHSKNTENQFPTPNFTSPELDLGKTKDHMNTRSF